MGVASLLCTTVSPEELMLVVGDWSYKTTWVDGDFPLMWWITRTSP